MTWRDLLARIIRFLQPDQTGAGFAADTQWDEALPEPSALAGAYRSWPALTGREMQVAWYIRQGLSNEEIALQLGITTSTVKSHVHHLLSKFNLRSRWLLQELLEAVDYDPWGDPPHPE